jgi:hypothetical protein
MCSTLGGCGRRNHQPALVYTEGIKHCTACPSPQRAVWSGCSAGAAGGTGRGPRATRGICPAQAPTLRRCYPLSRLLIFTVQLTSCLQPLSYACTCNLLTTIQHALLPGSYVRLAHVHVSRAAACNAFAATIDMPGAQPILLCMSMQRPCIGMHGWQHCQACLLGSPACLHGGAGTVTTSMLGQPGLWAHCTQLPVA